MDDRYIAEIEELSRVALARPGRLAGLTDEGVTRGVVRPYFRALALAAGPFHIVDVGAAGGGIAHAFLEDGWTADLFEPDPAWKSAMQRMSMQFGDRCRVHAVAVCDRDVDQIIFERNQTPGLSGLTSSPFGQRLGSISVPGVRLDTFLVMLGIPRVDFLKIDVEGGDFDVLRAYDFQKLAPALIFVEFSYYFPSQTPAVVRAGLEFMAQRGYRGLIFDYDDDGNFKRGNWQHRLVAIHADPYTVPSRPNSFGNVLFFRDSDEHLPRTMIATIRALSSF